MAEKQTILGRITQLAKANINALLDKAEDPQKMIDQLIRDYTNSIIEAENAIAQTLGNLRMAEKDYEEDVKAAADWGQKAAAASAKADSLRAGGDEAGATKSVTLVTTDATSVTDIEVVPIPTLHGICVLEGTMDELLANPDQEARASYVSITVTDDARPERMVPRIREVSPHALIVVHRPAQAPSFHPARAVRPSRDPREVTEEFYEAVGGRPLSDQERILAQDVWAQLRGKDMQ